MILPNNEEQAMIEMFLILEDIDQVRRLRIAIHNYEKVLKKGEPKELARFNSWDMKMAVDMEKALSLVYPKMKKRDDKIMLSWASEFRKMREIDCHAEQDIIDVTMFAFQDNFWKKIIITPMKLRQKFDTLVAQSASSESNII